MNNSIRFNLPPLKRMFLFICISALCLILFAVIAGVVLHSGLTTPKIRIITILQDSLVFIVPAMATAMVITRRPADFLLVRSKPSLTLLLLVTATILAAIPAMNAIINWNQSLQLPASMSGLEESMRAAEANAAETVKLLIGEPSVASLILILLIMGVLVGFSEEIYFRGSLQRLLSTSHINSHLAVWLTAIIFSFIHLQFFGFFPRLILGAYFGYLIVWSGSLWPAVWAHTLNNSLAVVSMWSETRGSAFLESVPGFSEANVGPATALVSVICVTMLLIVTRRHCNS